MPRVALIGLDCADPHLVFHQFRDELPTLSRLAGEGCAGPLRSVIPPITVPAWMCMVTGKDPGELGIYGFRNRRDYTYGGAGFAHSGLLKAPPVWKDLEERGLRSILLGVPMTYPPRPVNGAMVTGFLTPGDDLSFTYPRALQEEIRQWVGRYLFDAEHFRSPDKGRLIREVYDMTDRQFDVAGHLVTERPWDFFMMVNIGPDRMHHGLWAHHDPTHPKHDPESPYRESIRRYYRYLDGKVAALLEQLPEDTVVIVASDHGIQKMHGGIAINDWLIARDYLVLKEKPAGPTRLEKLIKEEKVDWSKTIAWAWGGYSGKLHLNIRGREPQGIVPPGRAERVLSRLEEELAAIPDEHGRPLATETYRPAELYRTCRRIPPDLIFHFGNLSWRSIGSVGNPSIWTHENDTGPDDANHALDGIFISSRPGTPCREITDVRRYILGRF